MKREYMLVELVDYAGTVQRRTWPKRDPDHAAKGLVDSEKIRAKRIELFDESTVAYGRTLATTYHIEIRDVSDWRIAE